MDNLSASGLHPELLLSSVIYSLLGLFLMIISIIAIDLVFKLNFHKELFKEHNIAFGIVLAGVCIAIAIIVAAAIS